MVTILPKRRIIAASELARQAALNRAAAVKRQYPGCERVMNNGSGHYRVENKQTAPGPWAVKVIRYTYWVTYPGGTPTGNYGFKEVAVAEGGSYTLTSNEVGYLPWFYVWMKGLAGYTPACNAADVVVHKPDGSETSAQCLAPDSSDVCGNLYEIKHDSTGWDILHCKQVSAHNYSGHEWTMYNYETGYVVRLSGGLCPTPTSDDVCGGFGYGNMVKCQPAEYWFKVKESTDQTSWADHNEAVGINNQNNAVYFKNVKEDDAGWDDSGIYTVAQGASEGACTGGGQ